LIDNEQVGIDVAFWFMQDTSLSNKIIARHNAGVRVRILVDPRANPTYAGNEAILNQLRNAGIPMRYKVGEGILHWKMMLFEGQNKLEFSGANYGPFFFVPNIPYQDYIDEAIYFTDDPAVVNSFKTKYDDLWTDTANYANYGNVTGAPTRHYPTFPKDPALNFPPSADGSEDFYNRTAFHLNHENQQIDIIMYRHTNDRYTARTVEARQRGVPVRMMTEQQEYRNLARQWDAYNIDLLYNAGVQIRIRNHQGLNHEKAVLLYGQGMTIFGSSNWTGPSSNYQAEHNYFTTKTWFFNWFVEHFNRKWNSNETQPFTPLPPNAPSIISPSNGATGQPATGMVLTFEGGPWAHKFDIYFGTEPNPPLIATDQFLGRVDNGVIERYSLQQTLTPGTTYYWRVVGKTMANQTASGPVWRFTTSGTPPPSPTVSAISPNSGSTGGGTSVTVTGANFQSGATVRLGGTAATSVNVVNSTTITAVTAAHGAGVVDVVVTNTTMQSGTLNGGYTYTAPCSFAISRTSQLFPIDGGTGSFTITTGSGCNWQAVSEDEWIEITSTTSFTGTGIISFTVNPNDTGIPRVGRIVAGGNAYAITQEGMPDGQCQYSITPTSRSFSAAGGSDAVTVTTESRCAWQATSNDSWITFPSANIGIGNGTVTFTIAPNTTGAVRGGTITVAGRTFIVKQKG
jgi:hypothetical protein